MADVTDLADLVWVTSQNSPMCELFYRFYVQATNVAHVSTGLRRQVWPTLGGIREDEIIRSVCGSCGASTASKLPPWR